MKPIIATSLVLVAAGAMLSADRVPAPPAPRVPWLHGFQPAAQSETPSSAVVELLARWQAPDDTCTSAAYGGLSVQAGGQTVLASYSQGAVVLDAQQQLVARLAPLACAGSADEIEWLAIGDAGLGQPVIAMSVTTGGHRTWTTWFALLRVHGSELQTVFAAPVEQTNGRTTRVGDVTLLPGTLIYRAPFGAPVIWTYDAERGEFTTGAPAPGPNA